MEKDQRSGEESARMSQPRRFRMMFFASLATFCMFSLLASGCGRGIPRAPDQGKLTACKSKIKNIATALEMYSTDWEGHYPPPSTHLNLLTPDYLKTIPTCPAAGLVSYQVEYGPKAPTNFGQYPDFYYVRCAGHHHQAVGVEPNFPAFSSFSFTLLERERDLVLLRQQWEADQKVEKSPSPTATPQM